VQAGQGMVADEETPLWAANSGKSNMSFRGRARSNCSPSKPVNRSFT